MPLGCLSIIFFIESASNQKSPRPHLKVMKHKDVSRRDFLKKGTKQGIALASVAVAPSSEAAINKANQNPVDRHALVAALGDTLIPSTPDPGYKSLEPYNITTEVLKGLAILRDSDLRMFNEESRSHFSDKKFLQLGEEARENYLEMIIDGGSFQDIKLLSILRKVYRFTRTRVFTVYYQNYPEHVVQRDKNNVPVLSEGDKHQITNPNTEKIVTGWDVAGYEPQLSWEQEEKRRARAKKMGLWIKS